MGKIRKPRPSKHKKNKSNSSDEEETVPVDSKESAIQTIFDQLQAANVEEKYCGLQTFALLIESPGNVDQVLSQGIVKCIAPLLLDSASSVRNAAAGALRNLSVTKPEACEAMMEQDVMTPLVMYFNELDKWSPDPHTKGKEDDVDTFIQNVNLLLNLCESSELAIKYLGQSKILDILPGFLSIPSFGEDVVTAVLQCLFVVVEDNPLAIEKIKTNSERQLQDLLSLDGNNSSVLLLKTLAAGVIINTCGGNIGTLPANVIGLIVNILGNTLAVDHRQACNELSSSLPLADAAGKVVAPKGKEAQVLENHVKSVSLLLDALQSSIEIIANICSCEDDDCSENSGESSDGEELGEEDLNNSGTMLVEDRIPPEAMEAMITLKVFEKVWTKTQLPAENVLLILKEYDGSKSIFKKLHNLQSGALLCVNNMISTLPIDSLGGVNGVYKIWTDAGKLVFKQSAENLALLESATAVMRAALDKIKFRENGNTSGHDLFKELALSDIEMMLTGIKECQVPEIRSNLIRMIGILALLLVNNLTEASSNVICSITDFILEQAHKENEVWVLAEAVDTLVDLYSEDETDVLAAKLKLVDKLATLAPILKNKARQQRRLPKAYKALVSTAASNLPRFIKYKKGRVSKLT